MKNEIDGGDLKIIIVNKRTKATYNLDDCLDGKKVTIVAYDFGSHPVSGNSENCNEVIPVNVTKFKKLEIKIK